MRGACMKLNALRRPSKYRAQRTTVDGHTFASKKEAKRYQELRLLEKAGKIAGLELQPKFPIDIRNYHGGLTHVSTYVADFRYRLGGVVNGLTVYVVEDVKGFKTPVYRLKKKLVEAGYGIEIKEV